MRVLKVRDGYLKDAEAHYFKCPGCGMDHIIPTSGSCAWGFNNNLDLPTFTPSILVRSTERMTDDEYRRIMNDEKIPPRKTVCHSFVTDGRIQFLSDSTHKLSGQTVDLPEMVVK